MLCSVSFRSILLCFVPVTSISFKLSFKLSKQTLNVTLQLVSFYKIRLIKQTFQMISNLLSNIIFCQLHIYLLRNKIINPSENLRIINIPCFQFFFQYVASYFYPWAHQKFHQHNFISFFLSKKIHYIILIIIISSIELNTNRWKIIIFFTHHYYFSKNLKFKQIQTQNRKKNFY